MTQKTKKKPRKTARILFALEPELKERLGALSVRTGVPVSAILRFAVIRHLEAEEKSEG